ncbi:zinc ribbon domain-containing protein [Acetanaerobacterium elongatum]|uniref:Zinc-ribbon domain-containing protein n=1 Tax=Acetanaerobacterium elongatum TaxID=258515 RepID=A0A1H0CDY3_9FIRM|nr:zinc ribbon domain-containing protein [Acetanaerobacterium elongatum]SDN56099.1 zinc-ribbon domain-containing protein [Acetanaerobacterium elongatum]
MAFFEKVGETLSSKSKDVAKKVKDMADVSRINSQIFSEEELINNLYRKIGIQYYDINKNHGTDAFIKDLQEITKAKQRIVELRKEANSIKGIIICANCGGEVPLNTTFCGSCGAKVQESSGINEGITAADSVCPACGCMVENESVFCGKCGAELRIPTPAQEASVVSGNICHNCGSIVESDAAFCGNCGAKIDTLKD